VRIIGAIIPVKQKIGAILRSGKSGAVLGEKIRELRQRKELTQKEFGDALGVTQGAVMQWEKGMTRPSPMAMVAIGRMAGDDKNWWYQQAGRTQEMIENAFEGFFKQVAAADALSVPLIAGKAAAGPARALDEKEIEDRLCFPAVWFKPSQKVIALRVSGDSMSPIIEEGYVVLVDISQRDPTKLVNEMVLAREGDGVTIKWLRRVNKMYQLVPQHTSLRHQVKILMPEEDAGIVGKVLKWIGEPPPPKK
jgi:SOS-response transcriptional repressor LexA